MATTSTIPTVKTQIVSELTTALTAAAVPVTYAWPGKSTAPEAVFLGPHPALADIRLDVTEDIPTMKAGRKQRQEEYSVRVTIWSYRPELSSDGAEACEARAFEILADIEDVFANDTRAGLPSTTVLWMNVESIASTLFPFEAGWACELAVDVAVKARLT